MFEITFTFTQHTLERMARSMQMNQLRLARLCTAYVNRSGDKVLFQAPGVLEQGKISRATLFQGQFAPEKRTQDTQDGLLRCLCMLTNIHTEQREEGKAQTVFEAAQFPKAIAHPGRCPQVASCHLAAKCLLSFSPFCIFCKKRESFFQKPHQQMDQPILYSQHQEEQLTIS